MALTVTADDPMAARGAIRTFWQQYRKAFGKRPYFSWAELQHRGAVHYHAILVAPPWTLHRHARRWIGQHWPHAGIQPSIDGRSWDWFVRSAGRYVRKYAAEKTVVSAASRPGRSAPKAYQQAYEQLPREIRTWECNRLAFGIAMLSQHQDGVEVMCSVPSWYPWFHRMRSYWLIARLVHTPPSRGCTLGQNNAASIEVT